MIVLVKRVLAILITIFILGTMLLLPSQSVIAEDIEGDAGDEKGGTATSHDSCSDTDANFLYFPTWYRGLDCDADGNINIGQGTDPSKSIFTIALNIIDIALRIAGILAVGFVIWGGFQYVLARGEPEKAKQALDTILKAVIGVVIAMIAAMVVSFVVWRLSL